MIIATKAVKSRKTAGSSKVRAEMTSSNEKVWISVIIKLCQCVLNGKEMGLKAKQTC